MTQADAERGRQLLELESQVERVRQELRDLTDHSNLMAGNIKQLSQQARTLIVVGWVSVALAAISLVIVIVILSRLPH
jgi:hypothetical protein